MKKLTKKAYNEAPDFMIAIDYFAFMGDKHGKKPWQTWHTIEMTAETLLKAMDEAEEWMNDDVYMIHLCRKETYKAEEGLILYKAVLANRGHGWHCHNIEHSEDPDFNFAVDMNEYGGGFPEAKYIKMKKWIA